MPPLYAQGAVYAFPYWGSVALWLLSEWRGTFSQRSRGRGSRGDRWSMAALIISLYTGVALAIYLAWALPQATITWHQSTVFFVGVALILVGVALRQCAIHTLGRYFTRDLTVQQGQTVVEVGLYRYIRHPSYAGSLLTIVGIALAQTNWASLLAAVVPTAAAFAYRIRVEETLLCRELGQGHREYVTRTKRLIPFVF